eukprot:gene7790-12264_t
MSVEENELKKVLYPVFLNVGVDDIESLLEFLKEMNTTPYWILEKRNVEFFHEWLNNLDIKVIIEDFFSLDKQIRLQNLVKSEEDFYFFNFDKFIDLLKICCQNLGFNNFKHLFVEKRVENVFEEKLKIIFCFSILATKNTINFDVQKIKNKVLSELIEIVVHKFKLFNSYNSNRNDIFIEQWNELQKYQQINHLNDLKIKEFCTKENILHLQSIMNREVSDPKKFTKIHHRCILYQNITPWETKQSWIRRLKIIGQENQEIGRILFFYFLLETENEDQMRYWSKKIEINEKKLFEYFENCDPEKDDQVKYALAVCHYEKFGVTPDNDLLFQYFMELSEKDISKAQCYLSLCYAFGKGTEKNLEQCMKWMNLAAEKGDSDALYNIALSYYEKNNEANSVHYLKLAAEQHNSYAYDLLGDFYSYGYGDIPIDIDKAIKYYELAIDQGNGNAMNNLGMIYDQNMLVQDKTKAFEFYNMSAEYENSVGLNNLGYCFEHGDEYGIKTDPEKTHYYFQKAADAGLESGKRNLRNWQTFLFLDLPTLKHYQQQKYAKYIIIQVEMNPSHLTFIFDEFVHHQNIDEIRISKNQKNEELFHAFLKRLSQFSNLKGIEFAMNFSKPSLEHLTNSMFQLNKIEKITLDYLDKFGMVKIRKMMEIPTLKTFKFKALKNATISDFLKWMKPNGTVTEMIFEDVKNVKLNSYRYFFDLILYFEKLTNFEVLSGIESESIYSLQQLTKMNLLKLEINDFFKNSFHSNQQNLKNLIIENELKDENILKIIEKFPFIESLTIQNVQEDADFEMFKICTSIQHLTLINLPHLMDSNSPREQEQCLSRLKFRKGSKSCPEFICRSKKTSQPQLILTDISMVETERSGLNTRNSKTFSDLSTESFEVDHPAILRFFAEDNQRSQA